MPNPSPPSKKAKTDPRDPLVERLLDDDDLNDHFAAREELTALTGPRRAAVADAVIAAATARTPRAAAIGVLGDLGDPRAVAALVALATHRDEEVREEAVTALGHVESHPAEAVPALVAALSDENEDVRDQAADALAEYASTAAVDPLSARWPSVHEGKKWKQDVQVGGILAALSASGPGDARASWRALVSHLTSPGRRSSRSRVRFALVELGPKAAAARAALEKHAGGAGPDDGRPRAPHAHDIALGDDVGAHVGPLLDGLAAKEPGGAVSAASSALLEELGKAALPFVDAAAKGAPNAAVRKAAERLRSKVSVKARR